MSSFPPCPLLSLPLEIVFLIIEHLNARSFAFLARTCRAMQTLLRPDLDLYFEINFEKLMLWAVRNNRPYTLERAFLMRTAHPGDWSVSKASLLHQAIYTHSPDAVRTLLAHLVDPDERREAWLCPLSVAVQHGDIAVVTMLLEAGANPNMDREYRFRRSPMELANHRERFDIIDLLVTYGAELLTDSESSSCGCGQDDDSESSSPGSRQDDDPEPSSCGSGQDDDSESSSHGSGKDDESDSD